MIHPIKSDESYLKVYKTIVWHFEPKSFPASDYYPGMDGRLLLLKASSTEILNYGDENPFREESYG